MDKWEEEGLKVFQRQLMIISVVIVFFALGYFFGCRTNNSTPPVEEIVKADSLIKVNDSIKIKVSNLDSIKNAKIIEVQTLSNDSTVKLFYKLIK